MVGSKCGMIGSKCTVYSIIHPSPCIHYTSIHLCPLYIVPSYIAHILLIYCSYIAPILLLYCSYIAHILLIYCYCSYPPHRTGKLDALAKWVVDNFHEKRDSLSLTPFQFTIADTLGSRLYSMYSMTSLLYDVDADAELVLFHIEELGFMPDDEEKKVSIGSASPTIYPPPVNTQYKYCGCVLLSYSCCLIAFRFLHFTWILGPITLSPQG
jgi:hypothetical protein